jgi:dipeptidase E
MSLNLLLLSSSRVGSTEYLEHALPHITNFLSGINLLRLNSDHNPLFNKKLLFVPYAGVSIGFEKYETRVQEAFSSIGISIESIHHYEDKETAIKSSAGIVIGGGNTFSLLNSLYEQDIIETLQASIRNGVPYISWSAGSNIIAPTIRTTNDMPIIEPPSFNALGILPWQINPHYIEGNPPGHNGETRQQRIEEFLVVNPQQKVIGIPEGTALKLMNDVFEYIGEEDGVLFSHSKKIFFNQESDLNQLFQFNH